MHLDHVVMQVGSSAARSAKVCLNMLDERTKFAAVFPSNSRDADTVLAAHHEFDNLVPEVRRWWSDNAPEFAAASRNIRTMRPFAHYRSIPRAPQTNGIIERFNRTVIEGARASLLMVAFPDSWWACAIHHWCMQYSGHCRSTDGFTPHDRRYGCVAEYSSYPFGALVFVAARPNGKAKSSKWEPRMKPHVLVDVGSGPGFAWNKTYGVVKLGHLLGKDRPSRAGIRYIAEVVFPDRVVYPIRLRLRLAGASRDLNFLEPAVADGHEDWALLDSDVSLETDDEARDGAMEENAPLLEPGNFVEAVILDPEVSGGPEEQEVMTGDDDVRADNEGAAEPELTPVGEPVELNSAELMVEGSLAPRGWRIDRFGGRVVSVPPWSRRPPTTPRGLAHVLEEGSERLPSGMERERS